MVFSEIDGTIKKLRQQQWHNDIENENAFHGEFFEWLNFTRFFFFFYFSSNLHISHNNEL